MRIIDKNSQQITLTEFEVDKGGNIHPNAQYEKVNHINYRPATQPKSPTMNRIKGILFRSNSTKYTAPYFEHLKTWAAQSTHGEKRQQAANIIKNWVKQNNSAAELNLSGLNLRTTPPLPDNIECLLLNGNKLTELQVPNGLIFLDASNNALHKVSNFSDRLEHLNLSLNQISELSLPDSCKLTYFNVFSNKLSNLPESILSMDSYAIVNVLDNPLSDATCTKFSKALSENDYLGPTIRLPSNISAELK